MTAAISLAPAPKPAAALDVETQAAQAIDARPKLQAAIDEQKQKIEDAQLELARSFASQAHPAAIIDVEKAFQSYKAEQELEERIQQRIEALGGLQKKLDDHLSRLKAEFPEAVYAALILRVEKLEKEVLAKETAGKGFAEEIKELRTEISKLPKGAVKKVAANY